VESAIVGFYAAEASNHIPEDMYAAHAFVMRKSIAMYCFLNKRNKLLCELAVEIGLCSIRHSDFNAKYAKLTKYSKQAVWGINWIYYPDEFPDLPYDITRIIGKDWKSFQKFLKSNPSKSVEIIIPPELLFPWQEPEPSDIEILESETETKCSLNFELLKECIKKILVKPQSELTDIDYLVRQTGNTNIVRTDRHPSTYKQCVEKKMSLVTKKFLAISDWFDQGKPGHQNWAVRTPTWKRPTEFRDAITLTPALLDKVFRFDFLIGSMLPDDVKHIDESDKHAVTHLFKKDFLFVCTDWKKSGLTMPHWFAQMVIDVIEEDTGIKSDFPVHGWAIYDKKQDRWIHPSNYGYGLGMVNNLYTLFNLVLFKYAQEKDIFDKEDIMYSFNDDSVIKTTKSSYHQWLNICRKSGGYLDGYKTYLMKGVQFCENYAIPGYINQKYVSYSHTLWGAMISAHNYHHWRQLVSQIREGLHVLPDINPAASATWAVVSQYLYTNVLDCAEKYWDAAIDMSIPFELGGISGINVHQSSSFGLRPHLVSLEDPLLPFDVKVRRMNSLRAWQKMQNYEVPVAPWRIRKKGTCVEMYRQLTRHKGMTGELSLFSRKLRNEFDPDREESITIWWDEYARVVSENQGNSIVDFWDWAKTVSWHGFQVPEHFVTESRPVQDDEGFIPFVANNVKRKDSRYSYLAIVVGYIEHHTKKKLGSGVKYEDIDLSVFSELYVPLQVNAEKYELVGSPKLVAQLTEFGHSGDAQLDWLSRQHSLITAMNINENIPHDALSFMRTINPVGNEFDKATWYTRVPIPYKTDWEYILKMFPYCVHESVLTHLHNNTMQYICNDYNLLDILLDSSNVTRAEVWAKTCASKGQDVANPQGVRLRIDPMASTAGLSVAEWLESIDPEALAELFSLAYGERVSAVTRSLLGGHSPAEEEPVPGPSTNNYVPDQFIMDLDVLCPPLVFEPYEDSEEEDLPNRSYDSDDEVAKFLDGEYLFEELDHG
jgi:hypothetical protein